MSNKTHKPGIHENYLVTRSLKLEQFDPLLIPPLVTQLSSLPFVDEAAISLKRSSPVLKISYDASVSTQPLEGVSRLLAESGTRIADGWWNQMKRRNYEVTDQNIYANARHVPSCCSKAPPGK